MVRYNLNDDKEKIKYEITNVKLLKESLVKRINYLKESNNLKASSDVNNSKNNWRKRSSENEE